MNTFSRIAKGTRTKFDISSEALADPRPTPALPQELSMPPPVATDTLPDLDEGLGYFLVLVANADSDLNVHVDNWTGAVPGQIIRAMWNGVPVGNQITLPEPLDPNGYNLTVPAATMAASVTGQYALQYRIGNPPTGAVNPRYSVLAVIIVDRRAPGGELLPQLQFAEGTRDGVTEDDLDLNGDLEAVLPSYFEMKIEDVVTPWIGAGDLTTGEYIIGNEVPVDEIDIGTNRVHVFFPRTLLDKYGDGPVAFSYKLRDRAGNETLINAPAVILNVELNETPGHLDAPLVPAFDDGLITDSDARAPVLIEIPHYDNAKVGDQIFVHWGSVNLPARDVLAGQENNDPLFDDISITYQQLEVDTPAPGPTSVTVTYTMVRNNVPRPQSDPTTVSVDLSVPGGPDPDPETPVNENLKPLIVTSAGGDTDFIPADDFQENAEVTIPWQTVNDEQAMELGDLLTVFWGAQTALSVRLTGSVTVDRTFTIGSNYIENEGAGQDKDIRYTLTRSLSLVPHQSTALSPSKLIDVESNLGLPGDGQPLAQPFFPEAVTEGGFTYIDQDAGRDGTPVRCPLTDTNIEVGNSIQLMFIGYLTNPPGVPYEPSRWEPSRQLTLADVNQGYADVDVPVSILQTLCYGTVKPTYKIANNSGTTESFPAIEIYIAMYDGTPYCRIP